MKLNSLQPVAAPAAPTASMSLRKSGAFEQVLRTATTFDQPREQQVETAAQQLVATTFLMPIFQMMRESSFQGDLFHGGHGEEVFGPQLDQHFADRIAQASNFPIVEAIKRQLLRQPQSVNVQAQVNHWALNIHG